MVVWVPLPLEADPPVTPDPSFLPHWGLTDPSQVPGTLCTGAFAWLCPSPHRLQATTSELSPWHHGGLPWPLPATFLVPPSIPGRGLHRSVPPGRHRSCSLLLTEERGDTDERAALGEQPRRPGPGVGRGLGGPASMWLCYFVVGSDSSCLLKQLRPKAGRMVCEIPPFPILYHSVSY